MFVNIDKTLEYYSNYKDVCGCEYCKNFYNRIKEFYPELNNYLLGFGINVLKPHELSAFKNKAAIDYIAAYVVIGNFEDGDKNTPFENVSFDSGSRWQKPNIELPYFIIVVDNLTLPTFDK